MSESDPFEGVAPQLRGALLGRGFTSLTTVQQAVLDAATQARNIRLSSQTGSGKTVAMGLVLARDLIDSVKPKGDNKGEKKGGPLALVIVPTRELATQVREEFSWLFADLPGFRSAVVTGGTDIVRERKALKGGPHVLVGTPGRLLDHMRSGLLEFERLQHVVLDEADRMLDMGFKDELDDIIGQLPESRRSHLVSATFSPGVRRLADRFQDDPLLVQGTKLGEANEDIEHVAHLVHHGDRYAALVNTLLLLDGDKSLVFVQRRVDTSDISEKLVGDGFAAMPISGELSQAQRTRSLEAFRNGVVQVLVATDVAARGIDVSDIAAVIHMDLPREAEDYVHRSGRTGRAGRQGRSIMLVTPAKQHQANRLLNTSRIEAKWTELPSAKKIEKKLVKKWRKNLHDRLSAEEDPPESLQEYAKLLLEKHSPEIVVATLVQMAQPEGPRKAFNIKTPEPRAQKGPRTRARPDQKYVTFLVSWGSQRGATASRMLAEACRRGGIDSGAVGAIRIGPRTSTFEVAEDRADEFAVRVDDAKTERDQGIRFTRQPGDAAPSAPPSRGNRSRGPKPGFKGRKPGFKKKR